MSNISSLLQDTENYLQSAKMKLSQPSTTSANLHYSLYNNDQIVSAAKPDYMDSTGFPSSAYLVLQDKIDAQSKEIDLLRDSVSQLGDANRKLKRQCTQLQEQISFLQERVAEKGVDLDTEQKIFAWKSQVVADIKSMQLEIQRMQSVSGRGSGSELTESKTLWTVKKEIRENYKILQDEIDRCSRDIDIVRNRVAKTELEFTSLSGHHQDTSRKVDKLDRDILMIQERHVFVSRRSDHDNSMQKEMQFIKNSIKHLSNQMTNLASKTPSRATERGVTSPDFAGSDISSLNAENFSQHSGSGLDLDDDFETKIGEQGGESFDLNLDDLNLSDDDENERLV